MRDTVLLCKTFPQHCMAEKHYYTSCSSCATSLYYTLNPHSAGGYVAAVTPFPLRSVRGLEDAVGQVLEAVVQLGGDGVDGVVDEGVEVRLKLLLGHADVEATL